MLVLHMRGKRSCSGRRRGGLLTAACISGGDTVFVLVIFLKIVNPTFYTPVRGSET